MTPLANMARLADAVLAEWIRSGDPMAGPMWRLWCAVAGVDPIILRDMAEQEQRERGIE